MHTSADRLHQACQQLNAVADDLAENPPPRIDFRERVRIERSLFWVIKEVCQRYLGYELHGLSEVNRTELNDWMESNGCTKSLQHFYVRPLNLGCSFSPSPAQMPTFRATHCRGPRSQSETF